MIPDEHSRTPRLTMPDPLSHWSFTQQSLQMATVLLGRFSLDKTRGAVAWRKQLLQRERARTFACGAPSSKSAIRFKHVEHDTWYVHSDKVLIRIGTGRWSSAIDHCPTEVESITASWLMFNNACSGFVSGKCIVESWLQENLPTWTYDLWQPV